MLSIDLLLSKIYLLNFFALKPIIMKRIYLLSLLFILTFFFKTPLLGAVISFEGTTVPNGWSSQKGTVSISSDKAKLGSKALCWNWTSGDVLSAVNPDGLSTYSTRSGGGITLWVYNTKAENTFIDFSFYNSADQKKCNLQFKLNFVGWRCIWAQFGWDIRHNMSMLSTMKITAPATGSGTLFFDFLEFKTIQWDKMANAQYTVYQSEGVTNYLTTRRTQPQAPIVPSSQERAAFETIANRMDQWYLGNGKNTSNSVYTKRLNSLNSYIQRGVRNTNSLPLTTGINNTVNGPGLFPMDFHGKTIDGVKVSSFRGVNENNLIQLAYDFRKNGTVASKDNALKIFDWYYDQGWADGSALGTLRFEMLRSAGFFHSAFMLRNQLSDEQFDRVFNAINWYALCGALNQNDMKDGELADYIRTLAYPKLCYALTIKNEAQRNTALNSFKNYLDNALKVAPGFLGTLKSDGSGYHHHAPYYSAYYPDVLYAGCLLTYLLHDTPYALSEESYQNLKKGLMAFRFLCAEYNVPTSTCGRFPAQSAVLHTLMPAFAYLILSKETPDSELLAAYKRSWNPDHELIDKYVSKAQTDICFSSTLGEADAMIEAANLNQVAAEANPVGTVYMPYSGLLVARQKDWVVSVKGFSQYIWDFEGSTSENLYGRYLSYDHVEYTDLVNHYRSMDLSLEPRSGEPKWDWRQIPGATTKVVPHSELAADAGVKHRNFSDSPFLGGIGFDSKSAMFSNRLHDNTFDRSFFADKSVFVFDNVFYCMGSGITSRGMNSPFTTTLFQNRLDINDTPFYLNGTPVTADITQTDNVLLKDNFGNSYIVNKGTTSIKKSADFCIATIDHGQFVDDAKYGYTWLIQADDKQVNEYKTNSPIQVLSQDATAHAVYHASEKILAASVFKANTALDLKQLREVSTPMIVMMKETAGDIFELAFTNPDMDRNIGNPSFPAGNNDVNELKAATPGNVSTITLKLEGNYEKVDKNSPVSVSSINDITTVSYDASKDGETYRVLLVKTPSKTSSIGTDRFDRMDVRTRINGDELTVYCSTHSLHAIALFDMNGQLLQQVEEESSMTTLNMASYTSGVYFVRVVIDGKQQMIKVIK